MPTPISRASSTCWKDAGTMDAAILSMPRHPRSMAPTPSCRFRCDDHTDHPISLYAATKKANELMAHVLQPSVPASRHGLALFYRLRSMGPSRYGDVPVHQGDRRGQPIKLFNHGKMRRDFTHIDDVSRGRIEAGGSRPRRRCRRSAAQRRRGSTISATIGRKNCMHVVALLEQELGRAAKKEMLPMQPGDVPGNLCRYRRI